MIGCSCRRATKSDRAPTTCSNVKQKTAVKTICHSCCSMFRLCSLYRYCNPVDGCNFLQLQRASLFDVRRLKPTALAPVRTFRVTVRFESGPFMKPMDADILIRMNNTGRETPIHPHTCSLLIRCESFRQDKSVWNTLQSVSFIILCMHVCGYLKLMSANIFANSCEMKPTFPHSFPRHHMTVL